MNDPVLFTGEPLRPLCCFMYSTETIDLSYVCYSRMDAVAFSCVINKHDP